MTASCPHPDCQEPIARGRHGSLAVCPRCQQQFRRGDPYYGGDSFVIYDLETTGLCPNRDDFIQIAALRMRGGAIDHGDEFFSYARPRGRISAFITNYTGITENDVRDAPAPREVLLEFACWAGDSTLIAHNGLRFDAKFLAATCQRGGFTARPVSCIDSIHLSKMLFGATRGIRHSLDHIQSRLDLCDTSLRRHDARGDVDLLGRGVIAMAERLGLDSRLNGVPRHETILPAV